jgi:CheY-like chemotaxis protein
MPVYITPLNILLAEDDADDRLFFTNALKEIPIATQLTIVKDGIQLMNYLNENSENLPHILFLDLSMPLRSGFECLYEIQENKKLKDLTVIVFTISFTKNSFFEGELITILNKLGAQNFIRKSGDLEHLKLLIHNALIRALEKRA